MDHERLIAEHQRTLAVVFDSAPVAMVLLSPDLEVLAANQVALETGSRLRDEIFGGTPGDFLGCLNALNDDGGCGHSPNCGQCALRNTVLDVKRDGRRRSNVPCEIPLETPSGEVSHLLVTVSPIPNGKPKLLVCLENVTDRDAAERRVERLNRLLRTAYEIGLTTHSKKEQQPLLEACCRILVVNARFAGAWMVEHIPEPEGFRVVAESGAGRAADPTQIEAFGDECHRCPIRRALEHRLTVVDRRPDCRPVCRLHRAGAHSIAAIPLQLEGHRRGVLTVAARDEAAFDPDTVQLLEEVARDLSQALAAIAIEQARDRIERELRASEERHRLLIERNVAGVFRTTPDGRILTANDAMARIFGFRHVGELLEVNAAMLYANVEDRRRLVEEYLRFGEVRNFEVEMRTRDRQPAWILINAALVQEPGLDEPVIEGTMLDITDARSMAEQLNHSQRIEAVGRLAGGVAHEFNNLLQAMSSTVESLKVAGAEASPRGLDELADLIGRGAQVARQLLMFSRRQNTTIASVRTSELLSDLTRMLRRLLSETIELDVRIPEDPLIVDGDRGQLEQVVVNLALNAQDAMPRGGRLTIEADRYHDMVRIRVSDTGVGIPTTDLDRIFEPFFTTKGTGTGTGLGLSVVHGIVSRFGGTVEVASSPGEGSIFTVQFPEGQLVSPEVGEPDLKAEPSDRGTGQTVLLVEDEEAVRSGLETMLEMLGYRSLSCDDVVAVDDAMVDSADVVLSDLVLPGGSGLDLCRRIRDRRPDLPVILMSGYSNDAGATTDLPSAVFLQKPFPMARLREVLSRLVGGTGTGSA